MTPGLVDHLLVALFAVLWPGYTLFVWLPRVRGPLERSEPSTRLRVYRHIMIESWSLAVAVLAWWFGAGRAAPAIGFAAPRGWPFWIGVVVTAAAAVLLGIQIAGVRASAETRARIRHQLAGVAGLLIPRSGRERRAFTALSLTAGFCEEVLFRGFLIWYLRTWLPLPVAVAGSAVLFGIAHLYQGWGGVLKTAAAGAVLGAAYALTGSLWVPIALHATVDVTSGLAGSLAFEGDVSPVADAAPGLEGE